MGNEGRRWAVKDEPVLERVPCGGVSDRRETILLTFVHCREVKEERRRGREWARICLGIFISHYPISLW
jgi:hypothetical protein